LVLVLPILFKSIVKNPGYRQGIGPTGPTIFVRALPRVLPMP